MKHNLDKYFKHKLNSPQQPPQDAWEFIQNRIPGEKEKKKFFPFWAKFSGIAATLLLMLGLGYWLGTMNNSNVQIVPELVVNPNENSANSNSESYLKNEIKNPSNSEVSNPISSASESDSDEIHFNQNSDFTQYSNQKHNTKNQLVNNKNLNQYEVNFDFLNPSNSIQNSDENILAFADFSNPKFDLNLNPISNSKVPTLQDAALNANQNRHLVLVLDENKKTEKKKKKPADFDRFYISAFASPLAFNTFVGNSMLADEMSDYHTENSVTLAYGVKAAYALSPKLKIRTGISMVGLEQITKNVPFDVQVSTAASKVDEINNVNYQGNLRIITTNSSAPLSNNEISDRTGFGNMQQQTSYVEIPVEAELNLFQTNSIGISATGGGSTWVLSKNKIYVHTEDYTEELGKANNLNNVTFSANAGLKFDMNLTESVKLNVEPNFRYLVNPVNNIEKYNPYTVGVNAGISVSLK